MHNLSAGDNDGLMTISERIAQAIYNNRQMPDKIPEDLLDGYVKQLLQAVTQGFEPGKEVKDSEAEAMIEALQKNVYQFSAAKSYTQLKSLSEAMLDDAGKLRTFYQFKAEALTINDEQINQWLKAEYDNAVACSQMAGKWLSITASAHTLPYLQYVTAEDARVRPEHAEMDGTTLPISDSFWNSFYPPNGWNCRCTVKQLGNDAQVTPADKVFIPDDKGVAPLFRFNPGKEGMAFPPTHPYFKDVPKDILEAAIKKMPGQQKFTTITGFHGGYVKVYEGMDAMKGKEHILAAKILADHGNKIELLPEINEVNTVLRKHFFPELDSTNYANPDARFNGILGDFKIPDDKNVRKSTINNALWHTALKKVPLCCIDLHDHHYDIDDVCRGLSGALKPTDRNKSITDVWIIERNKSILKIKRQDIQQMDYTTWTDKIKNGRTN